MESMYPCTAAAEEGVRYAVTVGVNEEHSRGHINTVNEEHPESHARVEAVWKMMQKEGLVERLQIVRKFSSIDESELRATHSKEHVDGVISTANQTQTETNEWAKRFDSVFATPQSSAAAQSAVACSRQLAEWIMEGKIPSAFALIRPPGHHADGNSPCGFCLYNNAAQAADAARVQGARKILIVDLDVHHGQGTQRIFYEDDDVLYFSIHRHEYGGFWPNLAESGSMAIGEEKGRGFTVNVPLQETGCGDADYLFILFSLLLPIAREYNPDIVIVSAGFDSLAGDPLGRMDLTPVGYSHLIHHLKAVGGGKVLMLMEGGYNHCMAADGAVQCMRVLMGEQPEGVGQMERVKESTRESVLNTISALLPHWQCLQQYATQCQEFRNKYPTPSATRFEPPERDIPTANIEQDKLMKPEKKADVIHRSLRTVVLHGGSSHEEHVHPQGNSYERRERIDVCLERLSSLDAEVEEVKEWDEKKIIDWINKTHAREYVEKLGTTQGMIDSDLSLLSRSCGDSFVTRGTWKAAVAAVATSIEAVDRVFSSSSPFTSSFALIRPPGHHAKTSTTSGFCFLNNVAIAAKYLLSLLPPSGKILIVDWDVHLGDGTIDCLRSLPSSRCLYFSIHRSDEGTFFPVCRDGEGAVDHELNDQGHVLLPLSGAVMGDAEYLAAIDRILMPVVYSFAPDAILVSAGFDCLQSDPLGGYSVSPYTLSSMMAHLQAVSPVVAVMEGGNIESERKKEDTVVKEGKGMKRTTPKRKICREYKKEVKNAVKKRDEKRAMEEEDDSSDDAFTGQFSKEPGELDRTIDLIDQIESGVLEMEDLSPEDEAVREWFTPSTPDRSLRRSHRILLSSTPNSSRRVRKRWRCTSDTEMVCLMEEDCDDELSSSSSFLVDINEETYGSRAKKMTKRRDMQKLFETASGMNVERRGTVISQRITQSQQRKKGRPVLEKEIEELLQTLATTSPRCVPEWKQ